MALIIAECVCHGLRISIVRGDVMDLNCDGFICGPPHGANPLAVLFPEFMSPRSNVLGRVVLVPGERCPSDWLNESEVPLMIAPPWRGAGAERDRPHQHRLKGERSLPP